MAKKRVFLKKPSPVGFFGFFWVLLGFIGFFWVLLGFFNFDPYFPWILTISCYKRDYMGSKSGLKSRYEYKTSLFIVRNPIKNILSWSNFYLECVDSGHLTRCFGQKRGKNCPFHSFFWQILKKTQKNPKKPTFDGFF